MVDKSPETVEALLEQIRSRAEKSGVKYIFRGEPDEAYPKVSSNLYRTSGIKGEKKDLTPAQDRIIKRVKQVIGEEDSNTILGHLQHYGGITNQIDFSTDYLIALFFACYGEFEKNGRLILLDRRSVSKHIRKPTQPQNRIIAQKSVFVCPPIGFVEDDLYDKIIIPKDLKRNLLRYLRKYHDIRTDTIYNDIHGYIRHSADHREANISFSKGVIYGNEEEFNEAIDNYDQAIEFNPEFFEAYLMRGDAHKRLGRYEEAIADYNEAIEIDPEHSETYLIRGTIHQEFGNPELAIADYSETIKIKSDCVQAYLRRGFLYAEQKKFEYALADYDTAIEIEPNSILAYIARGKTKVALQRFAAARTDWKTALGFAREQGDSEKVVAIQKLLKTI